ncbi:MAG: hypothetical protein HQL69_04940 [Magnetococcales bacterium]|nr:hypothetical protein [Magnetococcales bacterium]
MNIIKSFPKIILLTFALSLLSACSKEEVTTPKALVAATTGCFSASFSKARNSHPNDYKLANKRFAEELYPCLVWNILGKEAPEERKKQLLDKLLNNCPFPGLELIDKKKMIWCMVGQASPFVQENHERLMSGRTITK